MAKLMASDVANETTRACVQFMAATATAASILWNA